MFPYIDVDGSPAAKRGFDMDDDKQLPDEDELPRISTGNAGLDDILGGGIDPERMYLFEGQPGSGKTTLAERLGARPIRTDFEKPERRYPIVVDAGLTPNGLRYAVRATAPEGTLQSVSFYAGGDTPMPLGRLYTYGIRFFTGRAHATALLPQVMPLIEAGRLRPAEVTTRVVDWEDAPAAYAEPAIKLVVRRT
jgi:threonine dehydrogenase-like Zn-dependent dehydrogenase